MSLQKLRAKALRTLTRREHSRAELAQKLKRYAQLAGLGVQTGEGEPDSAPSDPLGTADLAAQIEQVVAEMAAHGLQSDARAAASVVHTKAHRFGRARLVQVMQARGLGGEVGAQALARLHRAEDGEPLEGNSEFDRAWALWQRRTSNCADQKSTLDAKALARHTRFLLGRGFSGDVVRAVVRQAEQY